jgi:hypothetical protein
VSEEEQIKISQLQMQLSVQQMAESLRRYKVAYERCFGGSIHDDCVIWPYMEDAIHGLRGMLNGETGDADCGKLDKILNELLPRGKQ